MNLAMEKARTSLPLLWRWVDSRPDPDRYMVKAAFDGAGPYKEHMWVEQVRRDGSKVRGVLANAPEHVSGLSLGDSVSFDANRISDWVIQGDCMYGGFTQRLMLDKSPPENAAEIASSMCPNPLPSEP